MTNYSTTTNDIAISVLEWTLYGYIYILTVVSTQCEECNVATVLATECSTVGYDACKVYSFKILLLDAQTLWEPSVPPSWLCEDISSVCFCVVHPTSVAALAVLEVCSPECFWVVCFWYASAQMSLPRLTA